MAWHRPLPSTPRLAVSYPDPSLHFSPSPSSTSSNPISPAEKTWIQQVVGSLLFYARALDLSILSAVCQLSSHQSSPTQHDLSSAHHLLNYVSYHRNPPKAIHPSSMALWQSLWGCTDASFLSRPISGSVAGFLVGLGDPPPYLLHTTPESRKQSNKTKQTLVRTSRLLQSHPFFTSYPPPLPTTLPSMPTAGAYPWWLRLWQRLITLPLLTVGKCWLSSLTLTLTNLGHPQQSPLLFVDNECAIGLATSLVRPNYSFVLCSSLASLTPPTFSPKSSPSTDTLLL